MTMNIVVLEADHLILSDLFAKSALFAVLAASFCRPGSPGAEAMLFSLAGEAPPTCRASLQKLADGARTAPAAEYSRLLGGTGLCPSDELSYRITPPAGAILADVAGFYRAFGYPYAQGGDEKPDHVAVELGFVSFLFAKEAHALAARNATVADLIRKARLGFLTDHLGRWVGRFASGLVEQAPSSFYAAMAEKATGAVMEEVPPGAMENVESAWSFGGPADVFSCEGCPNPADEPERGDL